MMPEKSNVTESYVVFTPLLQMKVKDRIEEDTMAPLLKDGLLFTKMEPELRRTLLDVAKAADSSDDVLIALNESEWVFWAQVPSPFPSLLEKGPLQPPLEKAPLYFVTSLYSLVAKAILDRIFNCLMIFSPFILPLSSCCWFFAKGCPGQIDLNSVEIKDPKWKNTPMHCYFTFKSPSIKPDAIDKELKLLGLAWGILTPLTMVDKLKMVFSDEAKWAGYNNAADAYAKQKAKDFAAVRSEETGEPAQTNLDGEFYHNWRVDGWLYAFAQEIAKLHFNEQQGSRGRRLVRAVQFLSNAHSLPFPHQFIANITCLEALFSKESAGVSFQLAARTAWFLEPDDPSKRSEVFNDVISLYKLRSDVVHGRRYSINTMDMLVAKSVVYIRRVLMAVLSNDKVLALIFNKNPRAYDKYLAGLSLGQNSTDEASGQ